MAITTAFCTSAKQELLTATHDFTNSTGDTFNAALIAAAETGTYGAGTSNYSDVTGNSDEASVGGGGTGYTAGGTALTSVTPQTSGTTAFVDFGDVTWTLSGGSATLAANGMLIYNTSTSGESISVHAFSGSPTASGDGATFTVEFPAPDASNAILRLA